MRKKKRENCVRWPHAPLMSPHISLCRVRTKDAVYILSRELYAQHLSPANDVLMQMQQQYEVKKNVEITSSCDVTPSATKSLIPFRLNTHKTERLGIHIHGTCN